MILLYSNFRSFLHHGLIFTSVRCYCVPKRNRERTHYDVLGVSKTCTAKEIRKAYIDTCKILHPDMKQGDGTQHKKFIELNAAYKVLSNPFARKVYDEQISFEATAKQDYYYNKYGNTDDKPWYKEDRYVHQFSENFKHNPVQTVPQKYIFLGCFSLLFIGSLLYISVYSLSKHYLLKKSEKNHRELDAYLSGGPENYTLSKHYLLKKSEKNHRELDAYLSGGPQTYVKQKVDNTEDININLKTDG